MNSSGIIAELRALNIDDRYVDKRNRRRRFRIQTKLEPTPTEFFNNNYFGSDQDNDIKKNVSNKSTIEPTFELELENPHYMNAIKQFTYIKRCEFKRSQNSRAESDDFGDSCGCTLNGLKAGQRGCGENCLNVQTSTECDKNCKLGKLCGNQRFRNFENARCTVFITEKKGFGLFASTDIPQNTFIMEFVGEVVGTKEFEKRTKEYAKQKVRHCYLMSASAGQFIDATRKGNLTRFLNHSCDPNADIEKWIVDGKWRIGVFSKKSIKTFEEITINYFFKR